MTKTPAQGIADKLNAALESSDVQICLYAARRIVRKGSKFIPDGPHHLRVNGHGPAFIVGTFKAYTH